MSNRDILKEALNEIKQEELKSLPAENEIEYEFSKEFKRCVKKLIKEQKKTYSSKALKRAIIILVAAILFMLIASSAMADSNKLLDFIYRIRSDGVLFVSDKSDEYSAKYFGQRFYTLNYIPEEYELTSSDIKPDFNLSKHIWNIPKTQKNIFLDQNDTVGTHGINTFDHYIEELSINGVDVIYVEQNENIDCFWKEKGYYFTLRYPIELGKDFIMKNAGQLVELPE